MDNLRIWLNKAIFDNVKLTSIIKAVTKKIELRKKGKSTLTTE